MASPCRLCSSSTRSRGVASPWSGPSTRTTTRECVPPLMRPRTVSIFRVHSAFGLKLCHQAKSVCHLCRPPACRFPQTFQLIFDQIADKRLPDQEHTPKLMMFDCCPKEESGFKSSKFARRGTQNVYCYFHYKRNWTEKAAETMRRVDDEAYRTELMADLDAIVWSSVR